MVNFVYIVEARYTRFGPKFLITTPNPNFVVPALALTLTLSCAIIQMF